MKTTFLLLAGLLMVCCRDRSAPPIVSSEGVDSRDVRNASVRPDARQSDSATSEAATRTQHPELWDPNDDRDIKKRLLERAKQDGVVRIVSVLASRDRYVFVGEFEVSAQVVPAERPMNRNGSEILRTKRPPLHGTDLWVVNKNGTGLQRLTGDGESRDPVLSPSGEEIAFISEGNVRIIEGDSVSQDSVFYGSVQSRERDADVEYSQVRFSPNSKGIAALAKDGITSWVEVTTRSNGFWGHITFAEEFERFEWNSENELVLDYGRFVFDWEHLTDAADTSTLTPKESGDKQSPISPELPRRLMKRLVTYGVMNTAKYAISPSGNQIVFAGEFEEASSAIPNKADLWVVNRNGTGLRRLTHNQFSSEPAWSPSGKEIAFVNDGSVSVINARTRNVRSLSGLHTSYPPSNGPWSDATGDFVYVQPRWSPNAKVITAEGADDTEGWISAVDARSGNKLVETTQSGTTYSWNTDGELVIPALGKFVFDWKSPFFKRHRSL